MSIDLKGYTALITGGSSGMGFEMARELSAHGATVVIAARPGARLENACRRLRGAGRDVHAVPMDVRDEDSVTRAAEWFREHFDHLDMLVNNAGIGNNAPGMESLPENRHFYDIPLSAVRAIIETNLTGYFLVSSKFVPLMVGQGHGSLVYVSTSAETMTRKGQLPYGPSKAGAEAMSAIMAEELCDAGIAVNIICPGGFTDTDMAPAGIKEFFKKNNMPILPPTIMNRAILFLASPASKGITGEKLIGKDFDRWLKSRNIDFEG
jgi:NAD(P)-dependent dehydrogenase (short-subunit alcohol dehydrogenase family)